MRAEPPCRSRLRWTASWSDMRWFAFNRQCGGACSCVGNYTVDAHVEELQRGELPPGSSACSQLLNA